MSEKAKRGWSRFHISDLLAFTMLVAGHMAIIVHLFPNNIVGVPGAGRLGCFALLSVLFSFGALYLSIRVTNRQCIENFIGRTAVLLISDLLVIILVVFALTFPRFFFTLAILTPFLLFVMGERPKSEYCKEHWLRKFFRFPEPVWEAHRKHSDLFVLIVFAIVLLVLAATLPLLSKKL